MADVDDWNWRDLTVGRLEARALAFAVNAVLANEDRELGHEFYLAELVREEGVSKNSALTSALRALVERGWLEARAEDFRVADVEARPARVYYRITPDGARAAELLVGRTRGWIPASGTDWLSLRR